MDDRVLALERPHDARAEVADLNDDLALKLRELGRHVSPIEISDVWVFPPLAHMAHSSEFFLFTRLLPGNTRRLCAARILSGNGNGAASVEEVTEFGTVPSSRLSRLIEGFRRRLGEDRDPVHYRVDGCPRTWDQLVSPAVSAVAAPN